MSLHLDANKDGQEYDDEDIINDDYGDSVSSSALEDGSKSVLKSDMNSERIQESASFSNFKHDLSVNTNNR